MAESNFVSDSMGIGEEDLLSDYGFGYDFEENPMTLVNNSNKPYYTRNFNRSDRDQAARNVAATGSVTNPREDAKRLATTATKDDL